MATNQNFWLFSILLAVVSLALGYFLVQLTPARDNFEERQSLRDSWFGFAQSNERLMLKFIVGNEDCLTHPEYRRSPYGCTPSNLSYENIDKEVMAVNISRTSQEEKDVAVPLPSRISFQVHHPIIIQKLGLYWRGASSSMTSTYQVYLFDDMNEETVVQVMFSSSSPGVSLGDYLFKPVESFILPKDFQGSVVVKPLAGDYGWLVTPGGSLTLETGGNVISYMQFSVFITELPKNPAMKERERVLIWLKVMYRWDEPQTANLPIISKDVSDMFAGNFMFLIHGSEELMETVKQTDEKRQEWSTEIDRVQKRLQEENKKHRDIVLVDAVDTYQNLPLKVLLFHKWLTDNVDFKYLLKTDDDCFLNIRHILKTINKTTFPESNAWWGNFRYNWAVQRHGKWAEHHYPTTAYPAFACGSGNMLSADLVKWTAKNYR
ncbi:putative UDP-GalNAc:beta-1,3-N-acetylgalactosaminyltransferase 2-like isoform X2 [Apostichopus japonicus]|uniref:Hexosyltransferase n=1 Tax=Stichopus japonicus TaxID=307972 RepID=A0A2G8JTT8_STIJA|nr:putative UDP-GalNAc:beta-1,3-N-acetylgalactosaminyltransferase 2-like isoform X2 [Apostichopus japonicus]